MAESRTLGYNPPPDSTERTRLLRLKVNIDIFFLSNIALWFKFFWLISYLKVMAPIFGYYIIIFQISIQICVCDTLLNLF